MKKFLTFVFGVMIGAAVMFVTIKFHVIRADDGFHMVPKTLAKVNSIYVDIREFTITDWDDHRELALDLANSPKAYLLEGAAKNSLNDAVLDIFGSGSRHGPLVRHITIDGPGNATAATKTVR